MALRKNKYKEEFDLLIDLNADEAITNTNDPEVLKENLVRKLAYKRYRDTSGLTPEAWCKTMCITSDRDYAYYSGRVVVPNGILNRSDYVHRKTVTFIKRLNIKNQ